MKQFIYILTLFISINLFAWDTQFSDDGLCGESGGYKIDSSFFDTYIDYYDECSVTDCSPDYYNAFYNNFNLDPNEVKYAAQIAANWWNEAGSEHTLDYNVSGSTPIKLIYNGDSSNPTMTTWPAWEAWGDICIDGSESEILVNLKHWNTNNNILYDHTSGIDFITTLGHEFGHLLGLDHWNETVNMMNPGTGYLREVHEDDKYGTSYIYGRDQRIIKTTTAHNTGWLSLGTQYSYDWGSTYETFAKLSIAYQKDTSKGYSYIVTWVDSVTKNVKYAFANDNGDDLVTYQGPFVITGSQTLSSPSIAINETGSKAVIVYKQEIENGSIQNSDRIMYAEINTTTGSFSNHNYLYSKDGLFVSTQYSKSVPIVLWKQEWENMSFGRFIIFWSSRKGTITSTSETQNWELKYAISDGENAYFSSTTTQKAFVLETKETNGTYKKLYNSWMPMAGTCDFEANDSSGLRACMLFFNETFPDSADMDYHRLTRVFITRDPYNSNKLLVDKNKSPYQYYRYSGKYNYGHLSVMEDPENPDSGEFIVTFMNAGTQSFLSAFEVDVENYGTNGYDTTTTNIGVNNQNYKLSRTGFAGVLNEYTHKIRFIWLVE